MNPKNIANSPVRLLLRHLTFILWLTTLLILNSCEELEHANPADPAFELQPPTIQSVEAVTDTSIAITWKNNEEYTKEFVILRKSGSEAYRTIGTVAQNILTFTDTSCVLGTEYSYAVQSKVESNVSANSNSIKKATTFPVPANLIAISLSDASLRLTWIHNCTFESGFKVERDDGAGFTEIGTVGADVTEYIDTDLTYGQSYAYRVAAYTSANTSSWTSITAATEFPAPSGLVATPISDSEITLSWTDNTGYEEGFQVERDGGSGFEELGTVGANVTEYTDTGLTFGQSYAYRVAAYTSSNTSDYSSSITAATEFPAPSDLAATPISDSEITLSWTDNTGYETGFKVERDDGAGFTEIGTVGADVTEYTDTGLTFGQSYTYRVAAYTNSITSDYSATATATAITPLVDYDGNTYELVQIGDQVWMAENLKVTHYRNGDAIQYVQRESTEPNVWENLATGAYGYYNDDQAHQTSYGNLYNWYAVSDSREIAPAGWHVPSDAEWQDLEDYLDGSSVGGGKLKESGTNHWTSPNTGATNESGFTALPGGYRDLGNGNYGGMGDNGSFWSATETDSYHAWNRGLGYYSSDVSRNISSKRYGFALRLLRD